MAQPGRQSVPLGSMIGRYRLLSSIGRGGMSVVYLGQSVDDPSVLVAIKVFSPTAFPGEDGAPEEARTRFRREAQMATRLDHPHILRALDYLDYTQTGDFSVIISPYVPGGSLTAYLATAHGQLPLDECARMIAQIASALDYAHQRGVIHRDIKPGNILRDDQGNLLLTDFGIARLYDSGSLALTAAQQPDRSLLTQTGVMIGTPAYMAPEQIRGQRVSPATDIYALGVLAYQLVTGRLPFTGASTAEVLVKGLQETPEEPSMLRSDLPVAAGEAILQALAKNPAQRYSSAGEFAATFALELRTGPRAAPTRVTIPLPDADTRSVEEAERIAHLTTAPDPDSRGYAGRSGARWTIRPSRSSRQGNPLGVWALALAVLALAGALVFAGFNMQTLARVLGYQPIRATTPAGAVATPTSTPLPGLKTFVPTGSLIYRTETPGACDTHGAVWAANATGSQNCIPGALQLTGLGNCQCPLGLVELQHLPGGAYPTSYIVQVNVESVGPRAGDKFGFKFDQMDAGTATPDSGLARGGYAFLIDRTGAWEFNEYDDDGTLTILDAGQVSVGVVGINTLTLSVAADVFTFYLNGAQITVERNSTHTGGLITLAVESGAQVNFQDFTLYAQPGA